MCVSGERHPHPADMAGSGARCKRANTNPNGAWSDDFSSWCQSVEGIWTRLASPAASGQRQNRAGQGLG